MPVYTKRLEEREDKPALPDSLRPYYFHGIRFEYEKRDKEAIAKCPFCQKHKFSVNLTTSQWRCFVCGGNTESGGGGPLQFLEALWRASDSATSNYQQIQDMKGLEYPETLMYWGVARSIINGHWLIPGYGLKGNQVKMCQLYKYTKTRDKEGNDKWLLLATPATPKLKNGVFGLQNFDARKDDVYICEGPWDGMRFWEVLKTTAANEDLTQFEDTASEARAMLASANVIAMPGCNTFVPTVKDLCIGKNVTLCYDNDYPVVNKQTGAKSTPAGYLGAKRACSHIAERTNKVFYLRWGEQGYDRDLPNGYDLRDILSNDKLLGIKLLMEKVMEVPEEWKDETATKQMTAIQCAPCDNWRTLTTSWRKALKWTEGLDRALCVMLASVASTNSVGDQLWVKVIGPPSCGKSTLSEAISINKQYTLAKSSIRGFHSGYKEGGAGSKKQDSSLIPMIMGKTLILKDGDTLLQAPNLGQILSEARDLYDSVSRSHYKNNMGRDYEGVRMTWVLCGTSSLRALDNSELGQRFLDCVVMERIDEEIEDEILWRQINRAADHVCIEVDPDDNTSNYGAELLHAMQLTGGYVNWLRENAYQKLEHITFSDAAKRQCMYLGKFASFMRSRPSKHQTEEASREMAARLVSQHGRLAKCVALVLNRNSVDEQVMRVVKSVALDTSRGIVLKIARYLYTNRDRGGSLKAIHMQVNCTEAELRKLLRFLREIEMLKFVKLNKKNVWVLTESVLKLCKEILDDDTN